MILPSPPAISFPLVRTTTIGQSVYPEIALHISNYYIIIGTDLTDNRIYDEFEDTEGVIRIRILHKRAARIILNEKNVMTPSTVLFNKLKLMPMPDYFV
jgi:hypothetical protein